MRVRGKIVLTGTTRDEVQNALYVFVGAAKFHGGVPVSTPIARETVDGERVFLSVVTIEEKAKEGQ